MSRIDQVVINPELTLRQLVRMGRNGISLPENVHQAQVVVADTGAADVTFTVTHGLEVTPTAYVASLDRAGSVYEADTTRSTWNTETIGLKCSVANAKCWVTVIA